MTIKEAAVKSIHELPEDATWEDVQERISFVAGVHRGLRELNEGKGILHEQVREELRGLAASHAGSSTELTAKDVLSRSSGFGTRQEGFRTSSSCRRGPR